MIRLFSFLPPQLSWAAEIFNTYVAPCPGMDAKDVFLPQHQPIGFVFFYKIFSSFFFPTSLSILNRTSFSYTPVVESDDEITDANDQTREFFKPKGMPTPSPGSLTGHSQGLHFLYPLLSSVFVSIQGFYDIFEVFKSGYTKEGTKHKHNGIAFFPPLFKFHHLPDCLKISLIPTKLLFGARRLLGDFPMRNIRLERTLPFFQPLQGVPPGIR